MTFNNSSCLRVATILYDNYTHNFSFFLNHPPQTSHEILEITSLGYSEEPTNKVELEEQGQHHLRDHPLLPLVQYTPRSDTIPPRTNHR